MCLYPRIIVNKKYTATKKNGGIIPAISDKRVLAVPVGCGECIECRKKKAREWQARLLEDVKHNKNGKFITLTFSDESIKKIRELPELEKLEGYELDNAIATKAMRLFNERYRKKYKKALRHWMVTELGHNGTENIHLHGIIWTDVSMDEIEKLWNYGWVWKGKKHSNGKLENYVSEKTVNYITKYVQKTDEKHKYYKSKVLTSAGIGRGYIERADAERNKFKTKGTKETFTTRTGHEIALPIYWRNKIYTEEEREKLWIEKLDKEERWIMGERVDVSKGVQEYYDLLKYHRNRARRLGYGDIEKSWKEEQYEHERRVLLQNERVSKAEEKINNIPRSNAFD